MEPFDDSEDPTRRALHLSGSSGSLSKLSLNQSLSRRPPEEAASELIEESNSQGPPPPQKTRLRRGSLRKVALLGRGAQRESRDNSPLVVDMSRDVASESSSINTVGRKVLDGQDASSGIGRPRPGSQSYGSAEFAGSTSSISHTTAPTTERLAEQTGHDTSTTDDEDALQLPQTVVVSQSSLSVSSGSDSYFGNTRTTIQRKSFHQAKSPLSYTGMASTSVPQPNADWDYSETEWWGWVVLTVTWFVFIIGMGSCLDIWSWAWDVGITPYAPPELEDDPTLPIVGYYPALIILTGVMAWVWVVIAWVGMKYFRHAKISGD